MTDRSPLDPRSATIVIPQFNGTDLTIRAIQSLRYADPIRWPVLIADNGSSPESLRRLHALGDPDVDIVTVPRRGLTVAWNTAVQYCQSTCLVFLNNDTVSQGPWMEPLLAPLLQSTALITGVELRREVQRTPPVELLVGWCFAVRRETCVKVRGFDPALQLYFSDTDFQLRVREQFAGFAISPWSVVPDLPITHLSHRTAHQLTDQRTLWLRDRERFLVRWKERH